MTSSRVLIPRVVASCSVDQEEAYSVLTISVDVFISDASHLIVSRIHGSILTGKSNATVEYFQVRHVVHKHGLP